MRTTDALGAIVGAAHPEALFVASLGRVASVMWSLAPTRTLFIDSLGDVVPVAAGLALAGRTKANVVAVDTDGSALMNLSAWPTLARVKPVNLDVWIVDNARYDSAGGFLSGSEHLDWVAFFASIGLQATLCRATSDIAHREPGAVGIIDTRDDRSPVVNDKSVDGVASRDIVAARIAERRGTPRPLPAVKL